MGERSDEFVFSTIKLFSAEPSFSAEDVEYFSVSADLDFSKNFSGRTRNRAVILWKAQNCAMTFWSAMVA